MGTSSSFTAASKTLDKVARTVITGAGAERAMRAAGRAAKKAVDEQALIQLGADQTLSGFGRGARRGHIKARARDDIAPGAGVRIVIRPNVKGLWAILEEGSDTTWRYPRRPGRRGRRSGVYTRERVIARRVWSRAGPKVHRDSSIAYVHGTERQLRQIF